MTSATTSSKPSTRGTVDGKRKPGSVSLTYANAGRLSNLGLRMKVGRTTENTAEHRERFADCPTGNPSYVPGHSLAEIRERCAKVEFTTRWPSVQGTEAQPVARKPKVSRAPKYTTRDGIRYHTGKYAWMAWKTQQCSSCAAEYDFHGKTEDLKTENLCQTCANAAWLAKRPACAICNSQDVRLYFRERGAYTCAPCEDARINAEITRLAVQQAAEAEYIAQQAADRLAHTCVDCGTTEGAWSHRVQDGTEQDAPMRHLVLCAACLAGRHTAIDAARKARYDATHCASCGLYVPDGVGHTNNSGTMLHSVDGVNLCDYCKPEPEPEAPRVMVAAIAGAAEEALTVCDTCYESAKAMLAAEDRFNESNASIIATAHAGYTFPHTCGAIGCQCGAAHEAPPTQTLCEHCDRVGEHTYNALPHCWEHAKQHSCGSAPSAHDAPQSHENAILSVLPSATVQTATEADPWAAIASRMAAMEQKYGLASAPTEPAETVPVNCHICGRFIGDFRTEYTSPTQKHACHFCTWHTPGEVCNHRAFRLPEWR